MKSYSYLNRYISIAISIGIMLLLLAITTACASEPIPQVIATIELPQHPRNIAVNPSTGIAYVLQENMVSILHRGSLSSTQQMTRGAGVSGAIIAPSFTNKVYVFDTAHHSIWVMDARLSFATVQEQTFWFNNDTRRRGILVHPLTGYIYALNLWDRKEAGEVVGGSVLVITDTHVVARIPVGRRPSTLAIDPLSGLVYVGDAPETPADYPNMLTVISGTQVIATSDLGQPPGTGGRIVEIVVVSPTRQVFVAFSERLYSLQDLIAVNSIHFDKSILGISYNSVNKRLYVMLIGNEILVLNTNFDIVKRINIPYQYPSESIGNRTMAIDPVRGYVYVGNTGDGTLAVIHDTEILTTLQVGWYTTDIGVDSTSGMVYVVNDMSKDVTVIGFSE